MLTLEYKLRDAPRNSPRWMKQFVRPSSSAIPVYGSGWTSAASPRMIFNCTVPCWPSSFPSPPSSTPRHASKPPTGVGCDQPLLRQLQSDETRQEGVSPFPAPLPLRGVQGDWLE